MTSIAGDYTILHHPFVIPFEGIIFLFNGAESRAQDGIFQEAIDGPGHLQTGGLGSAFLIGAAGGALQADAAVFP